MSSVKRFIKWFQDYYRNEYTEIPSDIKDEWIEEIVMNNNQYITKEMVMENNFCSKCGECCRSQRCPHVSPNGLCAIHDKPISFMCEEYPWGGDLGIAPLVLNCDYQVIFFVQFFDNFFDKMLKEGSYE